MSEKNYRIESDSMGEMKIPNQALYGASTQRAIENFPVSFRNLPEIFHRKLVQIKRICAKVNQDLKLLDAKLSQAIQDSAREIEAGKHSEQFVVDVFQTGSGTSTNMNCNEVLANLSNLKLGSKVGTRTPVHPNDHVNQGQSSNDVIPTAIHFCVSIELSQKLIPELQELKKSLDKKSKDFSSLVKSGRTHLQDATPITLGQEFSGYAQQIEYAMNRIESTYSRLNELPLGGTAVGTGINGHPDFAKKVIAILSKETGIMFMEAKNHFEAQSSKDACVEVSSALKGLTVSLTKIANDIRWLGSGPRAGIGEIFLPEVQPGSSIMPGKVNPVIPESILQVCMKVLGNDLGIALAGAHYSNFQLNVAMPLIVDLLLESIHLLTNGVRVFTQKCIVGIRANEEVLRENLEKNLILSTALVPKLGYDTVAKLIKEAYQTKRKIGELVLEKGLLDTEELGRILDPLKMV